MASHAGPPHINRCCRCRPQRLTRSRPESNPADPADGALARRAREQEALFRFTDRLYRAGSLSDSYDAALDAIVGTLDCKVRIDPAVRPRRRDALCRLAQSVGQLPQGGRRPLALDTRRSRTRADLHRRYRSGRSAGRIARQHQIRRHPRARVPSADLRRQACAESSWPITTRRSDFERRRIDLAVTIARQLGFSLERADRTSAGRSPKKHLRQSEERLRAVFDSPRSASRS